MKWIIYILLSIIVWLSLKHSIELDKLETRLAWEESKKCVIPEPPKCPEFKPCVPQVVSLPCENDCPVIECPECEVCKNYWQLCILEDE